MKLFDSISRRTCLAAAGALAAGAFLPCASWAAEGQKALIIYYSRSGNTEQLARFIAERTKLSLLKLEVKEPYAAAYGDMTDIAREEVRSKKRRELATSIPDLSGFDAVFIGSPYWWGSLSVPMATFLMDHPLDGKTIYPFITSGSSSPSGALNRIAELCPRAKMGEHFYVPGSGARGAQSDVNAWLAKIGF